MYATSFSLPPLTNIIEVSSKAPKLPSSSSQLGNIFLSWNKSSLDKSYKSCSHTKTIPISQQDRNFKIHCSSSSAYSDNFSSSSFSSYNGNIFYSPPRKHSSTFSSPKVSPYSIPSSPECNIRQNSTRSSNAQNGKKNRINFSKDITNILKDWLFANIDHPYPNNTDKINLSMATGLNVEQISNWFINGRRRLLIIKKEQKSRKYYKL
jgi:hypothetical protein